MKLAKQDYHQYLDIHRKLIHYAGIKQKIINENIPLDDFMDSSVREKLPAREALYDNIHLIDQYIVDYSDTLTEEEISIIKEFKNFRRGKFYVTKLTKNHALFMDNEYVFGVLALGDSFDSFWSKKDLPTLIEAVLLPYKGKIIYDGIFLGSSINFGRGISSSLKNESEKKIGQFGVILTLPIDNKVIDKKVNLEDLLVTMMKTKSSRDYNWYEIEELLSNNPELYPCYNREWGRINSRTKKKELRAIGIKNYHFAIYKDVIIANGKNRVEVEKSVKNILKEEKFINSIFYFKI